MDSKITRVNRDDLRCFCQCNKCLAKAERRGIKEAVGGRTVRRHAAEHGITPAVLLASSHAAWREGG